MILRGNDTTESDSKNTGLKMIFGKKKNSCETTFRKSLKFLNVIGKKCWLTKSVAVSDFIALFQFNQADFDFSLFDSAFLDYIFRPSYLSFYYRLGIP
jgi:hypothetical protein